LAIRSVSPAQQQLPMGPAGPARDFAADRCDEAPASRCSGTSHGGVEHGTPTVTGVPLQEGAVMLRWLT
jgi:hypothetical protein